MTRPDDIPEDVWDLASEHMRRAGWGWCFSAVEGAARSVMQYAEEIKARQGQSGSPRQRIKRQIYSHRYSFTPSDRPR